MILKIPPLGERDLHSRRQLHLLAAEGFDDDEAEAGESDHDDEEVFLLFAVAATAEEEGELQDQRGQRCEEAEQSAVWKREVYRDGEAAWIANTDGTPSGRAPEPERPVG